MFLLGSVLPPRRELRQPRGPQLIYQGATLAWSPEMEDPISRARLPLHEVVIRTSRSSGPGGQHANVTASRVEAVFDVRASRALTEEQKQRVISRVGPRITAISQDARSQARNRELALERLGRRLERALTPPTVRQATKPSAAAITRRLEAKRRQSQRKRGRRTPEPDE
jgi:ribosome-associated protein